MRFRTPTRTGESPAEVGRGYGLEGRTGEKVPTTLRNRQRRAPCQPVTLHTSQCPPTMWLSDSWETPGVLLLSCEPWPLTGVRITTVIFKTQQCRRAAGNRPRQVAGRCWQGRPRSLPLPHRDGAVYGSQQCSGKWYPKPQLLIGCKQTSPFFSSEYNLPNYIPDVFTLRYATGNTVLLFGIKMEHLMKDFLDLSQT